MGTKHLRHLNLKYGEVITIDNETNWRLLPKIDWHIMRLVCIVYGLQYLDS